MKLVSSKKNEIEIRKERDPYLILSNVLLKNKDFINYYNFMRDILFIYHKIFNLNLYLNRYILTEIDKNGNICHILNNEKDVQIAVSLIKKEMYNIFNKYKEKNYDSNINRYLMIINFDIENYDINYFYNKAVINWEYRKNIAENLIDKNVSYGVDLTTDNLNDDYSFQKTLQNSNEKKMIENPLINEPPKSSWKNFFFFYILVIKMFVVNNLRKIMY